MRRAGREGWGEAPGRGAGARRRRSREAGGGRREAPGPFKRPPSRPQPRVWPRPCPDPRRGPLQRSLVERLRQGRGRPPEQPKPMRAARPAAGADETELLARAEERRINAVPEPIPAVRARARLPRLRGAGLRAPRCAWVPLLSRAVPTPLVPRPAGPAPGVPRPQSPPPGSALGPGWPLAICLPGPRSCISSLASSPGRVPGPRPGFGRA